MRIAALDLNRFHHRLGGVKSALLMLVVLAWVWPAAKDPVLSILDGSLPRFVFSGSVFTENFNIIHAGWAMDQPTIGKWLFWFSFFTMTSLSYTAAVRWAADRTKAGAYWACLITVLILVTLLFCILSWPFFWLLQYIASMGLTAKRVFGLVYCAGAIALLTAVLCCFIKHPRRGDVDRPAARGE